MSGGNNVIMNCTDRQTAVQFVTAPWWRAEYKLLRAPELVMDFVNAPPGMPQHFEGPDIKDYLEWMSRTVLAWDVDCAGVYRSEFPHIYWAYGDIKGKTFWGKRESDFATRFIMKLHIEDGVVDYVRQMMDPLAFLRAAGREIPIFHMDIHDPAVDAALAEKRVHPAPQKNLSGLDPSPEAVAKRKRGNLDAYRSGPLDEAMARMGTVSAHCTTRVWFLPPEMKDSYPEELMERVETWTQVSCLSTDFDSRGVGYFTEDPHVCFGEFHTSQDCDWKGNHCAGRYQNTYMYLFIMDDLGVVTHVEEYMCTISKYNSVNISVPSFPYFL